MQQLTETLVGNTTIALLIALAAAGAGLLRRPALAHVLWLLVLVKLLMPPMLELPVMWHAAEAAPVELNEVVPVEAGMVQRAEALIATPSVASVVTGSGASWVPSWSASVVLVWVGGAIVCLIVTVRRVLRFRALLKQGQPMNAALEDEVREIATRMRLRCAPRVVLFEGVTTPMIFAPFGRATLILSCAILGALPADARRAIIVHELAHLRRGDQWVRMLELFATAALWWHPLMWLARRGVREAEEQCCDAWVVALMPQSRREYASALVEAASWSPAVVASPPLVSGLGQFRHLKRRLIMIMQNSPRRSLSWMGRVMVLSLVMTLPVLPVMAQEQKPAEPVKPDAPATPQAAGEQASQAELEELRARVRELEARLAKTEAQLAAAGAGEAAKPVEGSTEASEEQRTAQQLKARQRMAQDRNKYTPEQRQAAEELYQVANRNWRSPQAVESLKQMIEKFPDINRTGCAVLYLGQMSEGEQREQYLKQAVEKFSDCYYGNGVQVGGFARYLLGHYYLEQGQPEKAKELFDQILKDYPNALTHSGQLLAAVLKKDLAAMEEMKKEQKQ